MSADNAGGNETKMVKPCIVSFLLNEGDSQAARSPSTESSPVNPSAQASGTASIDHCPRSRSLNSPRRLRQVHFKELDECLSSLSIGDAANSAGGGHTDLPPRPGVRGGSDAQLASIPSIDADVDLPCAKKEKRLKLEMGDEAGPRPAWQVIPLGRSLAGVGPTLELPNSPLLFQRSSASCGDIRPDSVSPGHPLSRTSCSTPSATTPSFSPLSCASLGSASLGSASLGCGALSSNASPTDRSSCGEAASTCSALEAGSSSSSRTGRSKPLFERRGTRSPGQLSVKRSRSVHSRTWMGKREEVLGAEPGTPRLSKCDTL